MRETNKIKLQTHILKNLYQEKWRLGDKVPSVNDFAKEIEIPVSTVKQVLNLFIAAGVLISKPKKGYYVNPNLFNIIPISIRRKFDLDFSNSSFKVDKTEHGVELIKTYKKNGKVIVWVETNMEKDTFTKNKYKTNLTFMHNLANQGFIITKINSSFRSLMLDAKQWVVEDRWLFDATNTLIVKEKIFVLQEYWKEIRELRI